MARSKQIKQEISLHQVTILSGSAQQLVVDFDELRLDSGERARDISEPADLFRKLKAMKVPGIVVGMGTYDLLIALGRYRATAAPAPAVHRRRPEGNAA
jgi:hypothetical protein